MTLISEFAPFLLSCHIIVQFALFYIHLLYDYLQKHRYEYKRFYKYLFDVECGEK